MENKTLPRTTFRFVKTTYTGVAWARPQRNQVLQSPIQVIHNWPGGSSKNEQKVHTCLVYNDNATLSSWGYLCEDDDLLEKQKREFFKIFLDKQTLEDAHRQGIGQAPASILDAQRLVSDFLREVYSHIKSTVELHTGISHIGWQRPNDPQARTDLPSLDSCPPGLSVLERDHQ
ncbi:hypothetical protein F5B20DRAFT_230324 [Whalleya microplaca]|nr:hypothetical protein F5B20DRAFT_230324 [Whalleya microplaca]